MTLYDSAPTEDRELYIKRLAAYCALSQMYSNSAKPYLEYRVAENVFCETFSAENVSRSDIAIDAIYDGVGIGIKTFVDTAYQKVAEFDRKSRFNDIPDDLEMIREISRMRNKRLDDAVNKHNLRGLIYHYIVRFDGMIKLFECPMEYIDIDAIRYVSRSGNTVSFNDGKNRYRFSLAKSTLLMEFDISNDIETIPVNIMSDVTDSIVKIYETKFGSITLDAGDSDYSEIVLSELIPDNPYLDDSVILPLFSTKDKGKIRYVPEKSGINQWNAGGRKRDPREVYIPVPRYVHNQHPGFFPPRTETFDVQLPGGRMLNAKLCQSGDKGLMSNPNKDLGHWLLDCIFEQPIGKLVTYEDMENIRVNGIRVSKLKSGAYYINFIYIPPEYEKGKMIQVSSNR